MQTNHVVKKWQKINIRSVLYIQSTKYMAAIEVSAAHINIRWFFKMNEWNKVSRKQSHI